MPGGARESLLSGRKAAERMICQQATTRQCCHGPRPQEDGWRACGRIKDGFFNSSVIKLKDCLQQQ